MTTSKSFLTSRSHVKMTMKRKVSKWNARCDSFIALVWIIQNSDPRSCGFFLKFLSSNKLLHSRTQQEETKSTQYRCRSNLINFKWILQSVRCPKGFTKPLSMSFSHLTLSHNLKDFRHHNGEPRSTCSTQATGEKPSTLCQGPFTSEVVRPELWLLVYSFVYINLL